MQCPNCQHWNEANSRFCEECGFELVAQNAGASQVSVRPADSNELPPPPQQDLVPANNPAPLPYTGPRLILQNTGSIFRLSDVTLIGREDPSLNIDLDGYPDGRFVSHRHAQITKINGQYYIEDLGSSNHTWVNQIRLAQGQAEPLKTGDKVRLGRLELIFQES